jgi:hypothetical protein
VWIVASQAAILIDDAVRLALHEIIVTFGTQVGSGLEKELFVLRGVRIVTVYTTPVGGGFVLNGFRRGIVVALEAQGGLRFCQKGAVGRSMGAVTSVAPVLLNDGVKGSLVSRIVVAFDTKAFFRYHQ